MQLNVKVKRFGGFTVELWPELAPIACGRVTNAAGLGRYDGRRIERLEPGFVLQPLFFDGDDPEMDEAIELEAKTIPQNGAIRFERGTVAMAGSKNSASATQFFVTLQPKERLNGSFTVIGKVSGGWDTIEAIECAPVLEGMLTGESGAHNFHYPAEDMVIEEVRVSGQ